MKKKRTFECLRCEHHFVVDYDPTEVAERACPKCGSNSVRPESKKKPAGKRAKAAGG